MLLTILLYFGSLQKAVAHKNLALLQKHGLPVFNNENELAQALGIPLKELRFLSFSRKVSTVSHYRKFYIPKKSGGKSPTRSALCAKAPTRK